VRPVWQLTTQAPAVHTSPAAQAWLQAPQFFTSLLRSRQAPVQVASPSGQPPHPAAPAKARPSARASVQADAKDASDAKGTRAARGARAAKNARAARDAMDVDDATGADVADMGAGVADDDNGASDVERRMNPLQRCVARWHRFAPDVSSTIMIHAMPLDASVLAVAFRDVRAVTESLAAGPRSGRRRCRS
jgi:hypothetical protein